MICSRQAAVPAGSDNYSWLKVSQMDSALSFWNLMVRMFHSALIIVLNVILWYFQAYDYAGSWLTFVSATDRVSERKPAIWG